ncbi:aldose epimerase family protein [Arenibacter sp. F20364]|uniref:aldose epimerase family protein n=1 Tax=Arenibacter sp. F20364 TaxID=2926415 RepID=UPI001FF29852|nr:aldose epimerase family protein [Arenibacter sp. F20364]MCK0188933.1 galactose mutarotase [Arenibacter sp. F20364]
MNASKIRFGSFNGTPVNLFTLENDNGMVVKITDYGATITSIMVPVNGKLREVACGFDTLEGYFSQAYKANSPYFGGTVGRYCSQIKDAKFSLDGKEYSLAKNAGNNNLHGGLNGFDKKLWTARTFVEKSVVGISMTLLSKDMEEGFPGNVQIEVTFGLANDNSIRIDYKATTDQDTPLSMTNHTYFNLNGFQENVENHIARVNTDLRLALDETGAATGEILQLQGKEDDLRSAKRIGDVHNAIGDGFEHFYIFNNSNSELLEVANIKDQGSGLSLEVFSTEPCMLLYTGKYTSDKLRRENGLQYGKYRGFCCETHRYPNGPNIKDSPGSVLPRNETFNSTTIFKFK